MCGARCSALDPLERTAAPEPETLEIGKLEPADSRRYVAQRVAADVAVAIGVWRSADADPVQDNEGNSARAPSAHGPTYSRASRVFKRTSAS
jgi:hypothetical protein